MTSLISILWLWWTSSWFLSSCLAISPLEEIILELSENNLNDNNGALLASPLLQRLDKEDQIIVQNVDSYISDFQMSYSDPQSMNNLPSSEEESNKEVSINKYSTR